MYTPRAKECGKKLKVSRYSDSVPPYEQFTLSCRLDEGHDGDCAARFWLENNKNGGEVREIRWDANKGSLIPLTSDNT